MEPYETLIQAGMSLQPTLPDKPWPSVVPPGRPLPAVTYIESSRLEFESFEGDLLMSVSFRLDFHAVRLEDCEALRVQFIDALRSTGRLLSSGEISDEYDEPLDIYQRIQIVEIAA